MIVFSHRGSIKSTKRCYSEFHRLYKKTKDTFPRSELPEFPQKKSAEIELKETVAERKRIFDEILNRIIEQHLYTRYFFEFLRGIDDFPYFGYVRFLLLLVI